MIDLLTIFSEFKVTNKCVECSVCKQCWSKRRKTGFCSQHFDKTVKGGRRGVVVEIKDFHQYVGKVNRSDRLNLRNRKFLR